MAEAELIFIAWEIFNEISVLQACDITVRINHTSLLHAFLEYCGVKKERYNDIYSILSDALDGKYSKSQLQTHLISLCLRDQAVDILYKYLQVESSVSTMTDTLETLYKQKGICSKGLEEIQFVITRSKDLGVQVIILIYVLFHYFLIQ